METIRARLNDQEGLGRAEGKTKITIHTGSFTNNMASEKSVYSTLSGVWRKGNGLTIMKARGTRPALLFNQLT